MRRPGKRFTNAKRETQRARQGRVYLVCREWRDRAEDLM